MTRVVRLAVVLAVGLCYWWIARTANDPMYWRYTLDGYYDDLGRAFLHGRLDLPIEPKPELLALANPWDPKVDGPWKMWDLVFFHRRYYLYHGAGPAVMLFAPWRLIVGHDAPEPFGAFVFCCGGFLFCAATLLRILRMGGASPHPVLLAMMLLALGLCSSVPYLLNRVFVYEIAIAGGYFCVSAAFYFLTRRGWWLAGAGLMFGMAIACRPHLGLAGVVAFGGLALSRARWRELVLFVAPFCAVGLAVAWYNYARFGHPFEFGITYLFAGQDQQRIKLSFEYLLPGFYFLVACAPSFSAVFPCVRLEFRDPPHGYPHGYFIEPVAGVLFLAPFLLGLALIPFVPAKVRMPLGTMAGSAGAILLFLASTGFSTQRYEVDFLPLAVLASLAAIGLTNWRWVRGGFVIAAAFAMVVGLALGVAGPYNGVLKHWPATYMRIARWFSPVDRFRPRLNPRVAVELRAEVAPRESGLREPLLTMGHLTYRYFLFVQHEGGKMRLVSHAEGSEVTQDLEPAAAFRVTYDGARMTVLADGREALAHEVKMLLTAPAEITVGENRIDPGMTAARFSGRIETVGRSLGF